MMASAEDEQLIFAASHGDQQGPGSVMLTSPVRSTRAHPYASTGTLMPARLLSGYREVVHGYRGHAEALLAASGLDTGLLDDFNHGISLKSAAKLLEMTAATINCPDLGMRLASTQGGLELMGPLQSLLESAQRVRDYYVLASRFMHIYSSEVRIHFEELPESRLFAVRFEVQAEAVPYRRQLIELYLAMNRDDAIALTGGHAYAKEIWFAHAPLASITTYVKRLGATVRFGQPFDAVIYGHTDIDAPIVTRDPTLMRTALSEISAMYPYRPNLGARVRAMISSSMAYRSSCNRESIAAALGMHPRTLHRRLQRLGVSFEGIKEEVRRDLAFHYLAQSNVSLAEIAARLDYAEQAAFSRACQKWSGAPPSKLRRMLMDRVWIDDMRTH
jgi:AraC-like DNA-binding protein